MKEKPCLADLPAYPYEIAEWKTATVQYNYHISAEGMLYSVPYEYIRKTVDIRITDSLIEVFYNHTRIASHPRIYGRKGQYSTQQEHMPANHQKFLAWNGDRFRKWAESIGVSTYQVIDSILTSHFADIDTGKEVSTLPTKKIESKVASLEKKVDEWTGKHLLGYYKLAETGREYEVSIGWGLISPVQGIAPLGEGVWSFVYLKADIHDKVLSLTDLAQAVEANGAKFIYVQAPFKVDPYGDFAVNGRFDFTNANCDALLAQLAANGIDTLDLRENLNQWANTEHMSYHDFFFQTDHHWKPETALRAAKVVGEKILSYCIPFDSGHYDLQDYNVEILPAYFLGSEGKRATLARAQADDFSILHPKFPTKMKVDIPEKNIDRTGDFELLYDKSCVKQKDLYNSNPYAMYGHGDRAIMNIENLLLPMTGKKVLLIKDSYCDTMAPFLALGVRNLLTMDVRHFTGSIKAYIDEQKPDVIIVMYTGSIHGAINWTSHKDKFDF